MKPRVKMADVGLLLALTVLAVLIHGYHIGIEDQAIYLPAIKKNLDPSLYPSDSEFFLTQTGPALFDELVAYSVRWLHWPLEWALLFWHLLSVFLFLLACWQISQRLFAETSARWAAVGLVAALLTMPVAGTLLLIMAECLHPRNLAAPAILFALVGVLDRRATALVWLAIAAVLHPQMAVFGLFHLIFQAWRMPRPALAAVLALPFVTPVTNPAWREVMLTRRHHFPLLWTWYELLGALAPVLLLLCFARLARRNEMPTLEHVTGRLALSGSLGVAGAFVVTMAPGLEGLVRTQPMRSLHVVYILLFLVMGGLLGKWVLKNRPTRWLLLFVPLAAGMCYVQLQTYPASEHIEWPGATPKNEWVRAFDWIRQNTPRDAVFALDPMYMKRPGADAHGFRALAERSMMADYVKDRAVAALFPELAWRWRDEVAARRNWRDFRAEDFHKLRQKYGVSWVVVEQPGVAGLGCPYSNRAVLVCRTR
jgi:hypothetical protein